MCRVESSRPASNDTDPQRSQGSWSTVATASPHGRNWSSNLYVSYITWLEKVAICVRHHYDVTFSSPWYVHDPWSIQHAYRMPLMCMCTCWAMYILTGACACACCVGGISCKIHSINDSNQNPWLASHADSNCRRITNMLVYRLIIIMLPVASYACTQLYW